MGIAVLGGGTGIGQIGGQAVEGIARQPEAGGRIGTNMIIAAALIEGFTFTAIILAFVLGQRAVQASDLNRLAAGGNPRRAALSACERGRT